MGKVREIAENVTNIARGGEVQNDLTHRSRPKRGNNDVLFGGKERGRHGHARPFGIWRHVVLLLLLFLIKVRIKTKNGSHNKAVF